MYAGFAGRRKREEDIKQNAKNPRTSRGFKALDLKKNQSSRREKRRRGKKPRGGVRKKKR